jgi:DNA (cytosine-5)-methyltransferase 1
MALCQPYILSAQSEGAPRSIEEPIPTLTTTTSPLLIEPYLINYYGTGGPRSLEMPLDTVTTKDRFGLCLPKVTVAGEVYYLDILFRMLTPGELAKAMGFPEGYHFAGTKTDVVKQIGNAVPVGMAEALAFDELKQMQKSA